MLWVVRYLLRWWVQFVGGFVQFERLWVFDPENIANTTSYHEKMVDYPLSERKLSLFMAILPTYSAWTSLEARDIIDIYATCRPCSMPLLDALPQFSCPRFEFSYINITFSHLAIPFTLDHCTFLKTPPRQLLCVFFSHSLLS